MRLFVAAVGRLKKGPEQQLVERYTDRIKKSGKAVGIAMVETIEIAESRAGDSATRKREECTGMLSRLPENTVIWAFDERGNAPDSKMFAKAVGQTLDQGTTNLALIIGGPDGLDAEFRKKANKIVSFGALTIPHQLVRVLVIEQLYRSVTILTNHPYHRV